MAVAVRLHTLSREANMAQGNSRFTVHLHPFAGALTLVTWISVCGAFTLEVVAPRDPVERLYQMDAERDQLARGASAVPGR